MSVVTNIKVYLVAAGWVNQDTENPDGAWIQITVRVGGNIVGQTSVIDLDSYTSGIAPEEIRHFTVTIPFTSGSYEPEDSEQVYIDHDGDSNGLAGFWVKKNYGGSPTEWGARSDNVTWDYGGAFVLTGELSAWADLAPTPSVSVISQGTGFVHFYVIPYPKKPVNPTPADTDTEVNFSTKLLTWEDGGYADSYVVYMNWLGDFMLPVGTTTDPSLVVDTLYVPGLKDKVIEWRVDAVNDAGTIEGDTWTFDPRPRKVTPVFPSEGENVTLHDTLATWENASANTDSFNTYFSTLSGFLSLVENTPNFYSVLTPYNYPEYADFNYWRVDAKNDFGITEGDEITFITVPFYYPGYTGEIDYVYPYSGSGPGGTGDDGGDGHMSPTITFRRLVVAADNKIFYGT